MEAPDLSFATGHHGIVDNEKHGDSSFMNSGPATTTQRSSANGSWPAFPSTAPRSNSHQYNYGFGAPGSTSSWSQPQFPIPGQLPHSHLDPSLRHHPQHQHQHQHQSPTSTSPSPFAFQEPYAQRLSPISQQSISTTGLSQTSGSTSKRSLDQSSSDPTSSSKRRRSSTATALDGDVDVNMRPPPIVTLPPPSSSSTRSASVSSSTSVTPTSEHPGQGSQLGSQPRQTLLSPSQKLLITSRASKRGGRILGEGMKRFVTLFRP